MMERPNIVIFNPDQFRCDAMSHMGNQACRTPNFDKIANTEGVSFSNAFCQNPVCTPSRCSFMSGWYPHTAGHRTMHYMLHEQEPVLLNYLKENGYIVWWGGKNDLVPADSDMTKYCNIKYTNKEGIKPNLHNNQSWRVSKGEKGYYSMYAGKLDNSQNAYIDSDADDVQGAIEFIQSYKKAEPFLIYLALQYPHPPYGVEEPFYDNVNLDKLEVISTEEVDYTTKPSILKGILEHQNLKNFTKEEFLEIKRTYYGMCNRIDYQFGLLCSELKRQGVYDNTLIVILSDHGDFTGDYGLVEKTQNTFEDCLTNVPLIIKPPKKEKVHSGVSHALVELVDIPATICDYAGIQLDYTQFGKSLKGMISGDCNFHREFVFCEGGRNAGENHCKEVQTSDLDESSLYYPRQLCQSTNDIMHTKAVMIRNERYKYVYRLYEQDEFYDLIKDPKESKNRINESEYEPIKEKLRSKLLEHMVETADVVPYKQDLRF